MQIDQDLSANVCDAQQAERCNASRLVLVALDEWAKGEVRVKILATREESNVPLDAVVPVE